MTFLYDSTLLPIFHCKFSRNCDNFCSAVYIVTSSPSHPQAKRDSYAASRRRNILTISAK